MATLVAAETELPDPGITPDSPFYFADKLFDVFQSVESVANERASEAIAMAQKNHEKGLAKALEGYEKAMTKRGEEAENDEDTAEEVVKQAGNHLEVLSSVLDKVPEQAKSGITNAMERSAKEFDKALDELERTNPERAGMVAKETLERVLANTPEQALEGLQRALEAVQRHGPVESAGKPEDVGNVSGDSDKPETTGKPEEAGHGMSN